MLDSLKTRTEMRRKAGEIYGAIVAQARRPGFYAELGVPDTPSGRYEMVVLHLFLVLERLRSGADQASPLPRLLVEAFISDMDASLRELGTGDLAVPRKVRRAATGLYERSMAYKAALQSANDDALVGELAEHAYGAVEAAGQAGELARYIRATEALLVAAGAARIADGRPAFLPASAVTAEAP
jgi:cytochrome b pre-mRNA-processing protein 3